MIVCVAKPLTPTLKPLASPVRIPEASQSQLDRPRNICADQVPLDRIPYGIGAEDGEAPQAIARHNIARTAAVPPITLSAEPATYIPHPSL